MSTDTASSNLSNFAALEVPGEPGVYFCARHKNTKVRLRCGRCETPICPRCTMMTAVGARCKNCGSNRSSHTFQISPVHLLIALGVSLSLGAVGAFVARIPLIGLLTILYAPATGTLIGKAVTRATGGKRGTRLAVVSIVGLIAGALLLTLAVGASLLNVWLWVFVGLAASGTWYWIR